MCRARSLQSRNHGTGMCMLHYDLERFAKFGIEGSSLWHHMLKSANKGEMIKDDLMLQFNALSYTHNRRLSHKF